MASIKVDMRLKDRLAKQEKTRLAHRAIHARTLETLLFSLPKVDPKVLPTAINALLDIADQYKASQPLVDKGGRRSKPALADARASVAALEKYLAKAQEQLSNLPLGAMTALGRATDASIGKMRADLEHIRCAVAQAQAELATRPHKVVDAARNVLAYQVAVVFTDILRTKPSSTSDKQLKEIKPRGGAAYARVLRATLKVAGVTNYNQSPLITAGLRLLKDPHLPTRD